MLKPASRLILTALLLIAAPLSARQSMAGLVMSASVTQIEMVVGGTQPLTVEVRNAAGELVDVPVRFAAPRASVRVRGGVVTALSAGEFEIVATGVVPADAGVSAPTLRIPVTVRWPTVSRAEIGVPPATLYGGTRVALGYTAWHADGSERPAAVPTWRSSDPSVLRVDRWGVIEGVSAGAATVTASLEGVETRASWDVAALPAAAAMVLSGPEEGLTGDVLPFDARISAGGRMISDAPITWSFTFTPDDSIKAPGAAGLIENGRFVAEVPGRYDILALAGPLVARTTVEIRPRQVVQEVEIMGQGSVSHVHTSDLWVFEGTDGRDYAVTGTWGANGLAYFWDVTEPGSMILYDSIQVDARTVNDVKVSPDGRYAALSREGASTRNDGPVLVDLSDPLNPVVAGYIDDPRITGGVHNMFAQDDYLFALAGGDKYVIFDVTDLSNPTYVSEYNHPDSRIHDVWVEDGIAYSSEWGTGVVVVDVGNGRWGGSIENPVFVTSFAYPVGATHAAFPYVQESTGKVYLFLGDEILTRSGAAFEGYGSDDAYNPETGQGGIQSPSSGYIHIIDFTDPENPRDVARYEVPEFGTHNLWVEDDVMYVAYYEGGLRAVDVGGELMGNLANQGREISVFKAFDPFGYMANQPNAWGPQPYKGRVFLSDFNSGLWSIRLLPRTRPIS